MTPRTDAERMSRTDWLRLVFPTGIPQLWCPPLTHYDSDGGIDAARISAHLRWISAWVKGWLVPGSTGDGWELTPAEADRVLEVALHIAKQVGARVLVGALHPDAAVAQQLIASKLALLKAKDRATESAAALSRSSVCGFAVCPPRGAELTQPQIRSALARILELRVPTALYQLPQVTQNEMAPETVHDLATQFENFILFKDTSGSDKVARSGLDFTGVFLVRGMEGQYSDWLKRAGGPYDGFLLASANCFPDKLHQIRVLLEEDRPAEAHALSQLVSDVIRDVFALVKPLPEGNMFANGGKALDHFFAHGPMAAEIQPPRLHSGGRLPKEIIVETGRLLTRTSLMPARGYLDS